MCLSRPFTIYVNTSCYNMQSSICFIVKRNTLTAGKLSTWVTVRSSYHLRHILLRDQRYVQSSHASITIPLKGSFSSENGDLPFTYMSSELLTVTGIPSLVLAYGCLHFSNPMSSLLVRKRHLSHL